MPSPTMRTGAPSSASHARQRASRVSPSTLNVMSASFTPCLAVLLASRNIRARSASTSSRFILHLLPARLVDGGVSHGNARKISVWRNRNGYVCFLFAANPSRIVDSPAVLGRVLRQLVPLPPRRFDGGGDIFVANEWTFGVRRHHAIPGTVPVSLQLIHGLPPLRAAGRRSWRAARGSSRSGR